MPSHCYCCIASSLFVVWDLCFLILHGGYLVTGAWPLHIDITAWSDSIWDMLHADWRFLVYGVSCVPYIINGIYIKPIILLAARVLKLDLCHCLNTMHKMWIFCAPLCLLCLYVPSDKTWKVFLLWSHSPSWSDLRYWVMEINVLYSCKDNSCDLKDCSYNSVVVFCYLFLVQGSLKVRRWIFEAEPWYPTFHLFISAGYWFNVPHLYWWDPE
jgi:hypothetical protein